MNSDASEMGPRSHRPASQGNPALLEQPFISPVPLASSPRLPEVLRQLESPSSSPTLSSQDADLAGHTDRSTSSSSSPSPPTDKWSRDISRSRQLSPAMAPRRRPTVVQGVELKLIARNMPPGWGTWEIYDLLKQYGSLDRIDIMEPRRRGTTNAWVTFIPPPKEIAFVRTGVNIPGWNQRILFDMPPHRDHQHQSPMNPKRAFPDQIRVPVSAIQFGVNKSEDTMLVLHATKPAKSVPVDIVLNLHRKCLDVHFSIIRDVPASTQEKAESPDRLQRSFKMRFNLPQLRAIYQMVNDSTGQKAWVMSTEQPPMVFRRADDIKDTHEKGSSYWNDWYTWFRQTTIGDMTGAASFGMTQLQNQSALIDIGRWLTYGFVFDKSVADSPAFVQIFDALHDFSVPVSHDTLINFELPPEESLWSWLDSPITALKQAGKSSSLSEMQQMARETIHLPFKIRYQLEVCVSHGVLHECNITKEFLAEVAKKEPQRIVKVLEKAADQRQRFYDPLDIFRRFEHLVSIVQKPIPWYCAMVRAATVTPTTIYFMTPIMETSNRVIRKYVQYEDRFLRVKFADEKYKGQVMSTADATMNEVFTRIKCTMINGINVAGRHYEFLAFGNSQFREHGAWFFASTGDLPVQKIRDELGEFEPIRVVAKYCSRIGQCFTTTRQTSWKVTAEKIPDIQRNGFCFTDGVGKISLFLARMISQELGYPSSPNDCPSAFQFRREGCKGILVVDSALKNNVLQIRPSQEKFSGIIKGVSDSGLEIVRVGQFSGAYLNVQLILVLSALGVPDAIFVGKMQKMLVDLQEAMKQEEKALELLSKNIDYNQMTIELASMITDGFMKVKDPFTISCLHLWRSWSLKYLKEKARIYIEKGAFVLGCVDETATLKGHFNKPDPSTEEADKSHKHLPEIFLQINRTGKGRWTVIEGICLLMRNPSLHPGDVRVVRAVNVPALHHIRDCVVLPQTGDRDLPNMCSGGDLDGDDYLIMWDEDLMPKEWNYPPMDYTGPAPVVSKGKVTVDDMTSFFVTHMKHDILRPVAVAHKYQADLLPDGVKDPKCLQLAQLHSMAVDYAKTGVPAKMPLHLRVNKWPHWAEVRNKPQSKIYHSKKVIGQLYDSVEKSDFNAWWSLAFDQRILDAYDLDEQMLQDAREAKAEYDEGVRRVMAKYGVGNEFEVWTTFVLEHSDDIGDYKFAEAIGEAVSALKDAHQQLCYEKAGTTKRERDWEKMGPFIAAMYTVTAHDMEAAVKECRKSQYIDGRSIPVKEARFDTMPFISFPWLFRAELGRIANKTDNKRLDASSLPMPRPKPPKRDLLTDSFELPELKEVLIPTSTAGTLDQAKQEDFLTEKVSTSASGVSDSPKKREVAAEKHSSSEEDLMLLDDSVMQQRVPIPNPSSPQGSGVTRATSSVPVPRYPETTVSPASGAATPAPSPIPATAPPSTSYQSSASARSREAARPPTSTPKKDEKDDSEDEEAEVVILETRSTALDELSKLIDS